MRGSDERSKASFSFVDLEDRIPTKHPLRVRRRIADDALAGLSERFAAACSHTGRPSIPPERLLETDAAAAFLGGIIAHPEVRRLMSRERFSVDGALIEAWASMKSVQPKKRGDGDASDDDVPPPPGRGRNQDVDFRGAKRSNATHASTTDPDARLFRKAMGQEARLAFMGHALMENRNGLVVDGRPTSAKGDAEPAAAVDLAEAHLRPGATLAADKAYDKAADQAAEKAADKAYDIRPFAEPLREIGVRPPPAQPVFTTRTGKTRSSTIDRRTTRRAAAAAGQRVRQRIEEIFGWLNTVAGQRKTRFRGLARVEGASLFRLAAYNLTRLPKLMAP